MTSCFRGVKFLVKLLALTVLIFRLDAKSEEIVKKILKILLPCLFYLQLGASGI